MEHTRRLEPLGTLFGDAWSLYKKYFAVAVQILIIPVVLLAMARVSGSGILSAITTVIFGFSTIALIPAVAKQKGVGESYKEAVAAFLPIVWVGIINIFVLIGGFVMLIVPGIMMTIWFIFRTFTVMLEKKRGLAALEESKEYTRGYWWAILGRYILMGLIIWAITVVAILIAFLILGTYGATIIYCAFLVFEVPFAVAYSYVIYENVRAIKGDISSAAHGSHGFLFASALVGIAAPVVIIFGFILGAVVGMRREREGNVMVPTAQSQSVPPPGASGNPLPQY